MIADSESLPLAYICSFPGAGTCVLQALINQHKDLIAVSNSPLFEIVHGVNKLYSSLHPDSSINSEQIASQIREACLVNACQGVISEFYADFKPKRVIDCAGSGAIQYEGLLSKVYQKKTKIIILIRDLRSTVASRICKTQGDLDTVAYAAKLLTNPPYSFFLQRINLLIKNRRIHDFFLIRYEDLAYAPEATMSLLYDYLEISCQSEVSRYLSTAENARVFEKEEVSSLRPELAFEEADFIKILGKTCCDKIIKQFGNYYAALYPDRCALELDRLLPAKEGTLSQDKK